MRRLSLLLTLVAAFALLAAPAAPAQTRGADRVEVALAPVPHPGEDGNAAASGTIRATLVRDDRLVVVVRATGLTPNLPHAMHVHGAQEGGNVCPPASAAGDDGVVSTADGAPFYGGIRLSLTTEGDTSPASALALDRFPVADRNGRLTYVRVIEDVPADVAAVLDDLHVVVHGLDYAPVNGAYDDNAPLLQGAEATLPVLCGVVR